MQYSTVIVARNCPKQLLATLFALRARTQVDEVILVDNGSDVDIRSIAKLSQLPVRFVRMDEHLALGAAMNAGIDAAAHDLILLLHGDTVLASDPRDAVLYLEEHDDVGIIGAKLLRAGDEPGLVLQIGYDVGRGRTNPQPIGERKWDVFHEPRPIAAASSACMLLRRTEVRFDERYWFRFEDIDFCHQYAQRGWTIMMLPSLVSHHLENGGVRERLVEPAWAARRLASDILYHERWCSDAALPYHPAQIPVRGEQARAYLRLAERSLIGSPYSTVQTISP